VRAEVGAEQFSSGYFEMAREIFEHLCLDQDFAEFLTLPAYKRLLKIEQEADKC